MSTVSKLIFKTGEHYITSPFGYRTLNGTKSMHNGVDYGTHGKKIAQYAIEDGEIISAGMDDAKHNYGLYVWVKYPRLGVKMLHYHLDKICVKAGQKVNSDTILGYTGTTGNSTGVHLHLGVKRLSGGDYIDPEKWSKDEYKAPQKQTTTASAPTKYKIGSYKVKTDLLHVRTGAGITYSKKSFDQLTKSAQSKILSLNHNKKANGYVRDLTFDVSEIKTADGYTWGKTPSGWVALEYCVKI